ncbi:hypothetical protein B7494_g977 [Chlorociboria aeruginascens]|nr:hypothetical protein B7494_g977 [Chlorociboria aeruginascens]
MSSELPNASWNPAHMPNSTADLIQTIPPVPRQSKLVEADGASQHVPVIDNYSVKATDTDLHKTDDGGDNEGHPELPKLRNALETSLGSPGGVEMDEDIVHNGFSKTDIQGEKLDFPSTGPANESKHFSTASFARTVSHEVSWGEDDEVDPEWKLQRRNTNPFKFMAEKDRTNSFPPVPPPHSQDSYRIDHPLAQSQAEDIINEIKQSSNDLFGNDDNDETAFFSQQSMANNGNHDFPDEAGGNWEEQESGDIDRPLGGDFRQEEDQNSQARYEEGLPLVLSPDQPSLQQQSSTINASFMDDIGEEDDFFAQVSQPTAGEPHPITLERKSTMQVMKSMEFPHGQPNQEFLKDNSINVSQNLMERVTGGGIGASASTVLSAVLGSSDALRPNQAESTTLATAFGEGDLAATWQAALGADEDDDLLLDDDEIDGNALDPSAIFGSDDEGFLEDNENQNPSTEQISHQKSPPIPNQVTSPNGHIVGFDNLTGSAHTIANRPSSSSSRYLPAGASSIIPPPNNAYTPTAPLLTDLSRSAVTPSGTSPYYGSTPTNLPQQSDQRPTMSKTHSFANQSKDGYSSPYDLPMEVVKPRKRVSLQQMNHIYNAPMVAAPPRSSSINTQQPPPSRGSTASLSPPTSGNSFQQSQLQLPSNNTTQASPASAKPKGPAHGFFEDLPMVSKPRSATRQSSGRNTPQTPHAPPMNNASHYPGQGDYRQVPLSHQLQANPPALTPGGLVAPERVSPYANLPTNQALVPPIASRYSPAPPSAHSQTAPPPTSQSRYSPAPPGSRPQMHSYNSQPGTAPPAPVLPHMPRTSSPLAHFERTNDHRSYQPHGDVINDRRSSSSGYEPSLRPSPLPPTREVDESENVYTGDHDEQSTTFPPQYTQQPQTLSQPSHMMPPHSQTPPPSGPRAVKSSPKRIASSNYLPQSAGFVPPQRSQTQSPGTSSAGPRLEMNVAEPYQRPASVEIPTSPRANNINGFAPSSSLSRRVRSFSQAQNYMAPTDGRELDPLQRWKGSPVFAWGVGGTIITSFPKDVPRYGMNQPVPMTIRAPGEVKVRNIKDLGPLEERLTNFPGPLKGKAKKKDVIAWLLSGINLLEHNASYLRSIPNLSHEDKRIEERILLWKIVRVFIEHDGVLEGSPVVEKAVRAVLSPGLDDNAQGDPLYATGADLSGISASVTSMTKSDPVDPNAVDQLRKHLLRGDREKAVWEAVDKRLWAHAMLISNTVSKDLFRQVTQEFVQKEVKNIGDNTESLAALYEIFAGNFEESIDELVPPSARAGFQMVSTSNASGPSKDALDGLDRWRETLGLVLSNRCTDDSQALTALGKLLAGYGRAEAAHICFLFARSHSVFGGIDDPLANIVLVGSDHLRQPYEFDKELEPILLSEIYEYGLSLSSTSNIPISIAHLAVYKLQHAMILAEYGYREKALQYCEAIASSITSQTRRSSYHNPLLIASLDDLSKRLKQSPKDGTSSWMSKPSIDKVSGSVWATFNKFVAGDEQDAEATSSNPGIAGELGPFSRIAGDTPTISRSPSNSELYGGYNGGSVMNGSASIVTALKTNMRYAPGSSYTPSTAHDGSPYGSQPRSSLEERSSGEHRRASFEPRRQASQLSDYRPDSQPAVSDHTPQYNSAYTLRTPHSSYGSTASPYGNSPHASQVQQSISAPQLISPTSVDQSQPLDNLDGQHQFPSYNPAEPSYGQSYSGYNPPENDSYEPPSSGGYEPPSYEPDMTNDEPDSPIDARPKESFMDDNEDSIPALKAASAAEKTTAEKDREADEAFRKAAEADGKHANFMSVTSHADSFIAKKDAGSAPKKGWGLGGWFGGGKKEAADVPQTNKPIRAKLGEASSFVYDPELKRWVDKKAGSNSTPTPTATPPPPKSGPLRPSFGAPGGSTFAPRSVSTPAAPPLRHMASRTSDAGSFDGPPTESFGLTPPPPSMSRSQSNGSANGLPVAPPSRPTTSMSNASSIDDLLGPPTSRKGPAKKAKKGRGYIDVMGDKAS